MARPVCIGSCPCIGQGAPSSSPGLTTPFKHVERSNVQYGVHVGAVPFRAIPTSVRHVAPPMSPPSHASYPARTPSPHTAGPEPPAPLAPAPPAPAPLLLALALALA